MKNLTSADLEHEIPTGSKLYFGESAILKRKIENTASDILLNNGFNEIVTPFFSYHQYLSVPRENILKLYDAINHDLYLRSDSTVDVVRITQRRIKNKELKRWFYVQPIFKYPSKEYHQIGAELISENNIPLTINITKEIFSKFDLKPTLQISNIKIPKIICKILDIPISVFEKGDINVLLDKKLKWVDEIAKASKLEDVEKLRTIVPEELVEQINLVYDLMVKIDYDNIKVSLFYYSKMKYYEEIFFRFLNENLILCSGGKYELDNLESSGFAIFIDSFIKIGVQRKDNE